jgi:hypothetical protein
MGRFPRQPVAEEGTSYRAPRAARPTSPPRAVGRSACTWRFCSTPRRGGRRPAARWEGGGRQCVAHLRGGELPRVSLRRRIPRVADTRAVRAAMRRLACDISHAPWGVSIETYLLHGNHYVTLAQPHIKMSVKRGSVQSRCILGRLRLRSTAIGFF